MSWLREFVDVPWSARELGSRLTMSGFELEALETAAPAFSGIVVAEIVEAARHPQADKLQVCKVRAGGASSKGEALLQIVCGAANARAGLKTALATVGAKLPGGHAIAAAKLRGVESFGMLCSAKELGLADSSEGIIELPADAPVGQDLRACMQLDDEILELNVTPNRGDAMSVLGIAREVAALTRSTVRLPEPAPAMALQETFPVRLSAPAGCPKFTCRVVRGINNKTPSPPWLRERLRRAGLRPISPVVDITQYVMLELGQPMHAYDLNKLKGGLEARFARPGEAATLLDGKEIKLTPDVVVIADQSGPVGMGGVMGGLASSCTADTTDILFEAAFFPPAAIAGRGRRYGLVTDAGQRFERGVDPAHQERAISHATGLLLSIAGGKAGPTHVVQDSDALPKRAEVALRRERIGRLLGTTIADNDVKATLESLGMRVLASADGWLVTPPSHRFDINIEADLIEELARVVGFESIAEADATVRQKVRALPEGSPVESQALEILAGRGYQEAITYAFVDPARQNKLFPGVVTPVISNPISSDMAVMRASLWPGLLKVAQENLRRQQDRVRLFEHGARFAENSETDLIAGIAIGSRRPEQWGMESQPVDFFDVKQDLDALFARTGASDEFGYVTDTLECLHPGRSARITRCGKTIGWIGELHPQLVQEFDFTYAPILFEVDYQQALAAKMPRFEEISRFPRVRRDLAVVVDEKVSLRQLIDRVTFAASSLLRDIRVFDVFRGPGIETGRKSVALGLIFQDNSRTLADEDADRLLAAIRADLSATLGAGFRE
ncbi:MAG TPA: phenylalanine--tRNA ligase subunit beta [Steroidobacteraceae bacterium]|jgi:phenylalanyl-tRNA synthetase beta chain|nr:phenylalanine--tRNA ligase subunit beta [Steroidobacteraceae bacterium]